MPKTRMSGGELESQLELTQVRLVKRRIKQALRGLEVMEAYLLRERREQRERSHMLTGAEREATEALLGGPLVPERKDAGRPDEGGN